MPSGHQQLLADYFFRYNVPTEDAEYVTRPVGHHIHRRVLFFKAGAKIFEPYTGSYFTTVSAGEIKKLNEAVSSSRRALQGLWSKFPALERQGLLLKLVETMQVGAKFLTHIEAIISLRPAF